MKNQTIRMIVILAVVSIIGISITQFIWFRKAFDLRERQFNYNVNIALKNVGEDITRFNQSPPLQINPVNQVSGNYFVVRINDAIDANLLEQLLINQFQQRSILNDFEYGIYDCTHEKMVYGNYVSLDRDEKTVKAGSLPKWEDDSYYFGVFFPEKSSYLLGQMNIWLFSTLVLMVVILFFAYTLFVILKQKRLSEIQKDFINNMTHELKTPISTISVSAEVLNSPEITSQPSRIRQYAGIIYDESTRIRKQVERVLQVSRMENKLDLEKQATDVHQLLEESVQLFRNKFRQKNGEIRYDPGAGDHNTLLDHNHFSNAVNNLIDNALKYSKETPYLEISTWNKDKSLFISFRDQGIGIEKRYLKQVFDKFFRVPTGDIHNVKGFGLGLNYVKKIIHGHRGRITLESQSEKGSIFTIQIPVHA
jgi:two-component system phosphate regulon sensor histidine kinase PhoR